MCCDGSHGCAVCGGWWDTAVGVASGDVVVLLEGGRRKVAAEEKWGLITLLFCQRDGRGGSGSCCRACVLFW